MHHLQSVDPDSFTRKSFISWDECAFTVPAQLERESLPSHGSFLANSWLFNLEG
jgi:hypothetical protein